MKKCIRRETRIYVPSKNVMKFTKIFTPIADLTNSIAIKTSNWDVIRELHAHFDTLPPYFFCMFPDIRIPSNNFNECSSYVPGTMAMSCVLTCVQQEPTPAIHT